MNLIEDELFFYWFCNKLPQCLKKTQSYFLRVLEVSSQKCLMLKSMYHQGCVPFWNLQRRIYFFPFPTSRGHLLLLIHGPLLPTSKFKSLSYYPVSPLPPSSMYRDPVTLMITLGLLGKWGIIFCSQGQLISNPDTSVTFISLCNTKALWQGRGMWNK